MILTCPSCATRYQIDGGQLSDSGAKVRCHLCSHQWHAQQADLEEEPVAGPVESLRSKLKETSGDADSPGTNGRVSTILLAALLVVVSVAMILWLGRDSLVRQFPGMATFYDSLSFVDSVPGEGLLLTGVRSVSRLDEGTRTLIVEGTVENPTNSEKTLPALQIRLIDQAGEELERWVTPLPRPSLLAGEKVFFSSTLRDAPSVQTEAAIRFIEPE